VTLPGSSLRRLSITATIPSYSNWIPAYDSNQDPHEFTYKTSSPNKSSRSGGHRTSTILTSSISNMVAVRNCNRPELKVTKAEYIVLKTGCPVTLRHSFWVRIPSSCRVKSVITIWVQGGTARESYSIVKCARIKRGGHESTHRLVEDKFLFTSKTLVFWRV